MVEQTVTIRHDDAALGGFLEIPSKPAGIVLFAHGSGSGRFSPRNRFVARQLQQGGIATLLIDLLMTDEAEDQRNVFDIDLLSDRVLIASAWLREDFRTKELPLGYFGASTGAAAALQAAARASFEVGAIVSRGGRPDLAERFLPQVIAPTPAPGRQRRSPRDRDESACLPASRRPKAPDDNSGCDAFV